MTARPRRQADRAVDRLLRLPPPITAYTINRNVKVPMRDGVELIADHYAPTDAGKVKGTVLVRGPYGRGFQMSSRVARIYSARGYNVVLQSVRGTYGSGGVFEPMVQEFPDGADTVAWLRRQPWFTGRFATLGPSYLGFTQWAVLNDAPPELAAAVIPVGFHDFGTSAWGSGAFGLGDVLFWSYLVGTQEHGGLVRSLIRGLRSPRRVLTATRAMPLGEAGRALLGGVAPWFESWLEHPDRLDPYWEPFGFDAALDRIDVPVLLISGWQDVFLEQTFEQYHRLRRRGVDVALTVGPWTHSQVNTVGAGRVARESLEWLDKHVGGATDLPARSPVRVGITGDGWAELPHWPPENSLQMLFPQPDASLADSPSPATEAFSEFMFKPEDPTPAVGGRILFTASGHRDDSVLTRRPDVLSFTGEPLPTDVDVIGNPVVELWHSADNPHVDVFARISEVDARGRSRNVCDGYRRLAATSEPNLVRIELDPTAYRFRAGSRIRLLVAGGAHPRFSRNPGTGEPPLTATRLAAATHRVHHGADRASRLILPTTVPG